LIPKVDARLQAGKKREIPIIADYSRVTYACQKLDTIKIKELESAILKLKINVCDPLVKIAFPRTVSVET
jgi:hypothetical protein